MHNAISIFSNKGRNAKLKDQKWNFSTMTLKILVISH